MYIANNRLKSIFGAPSRTFLPQTPRQRLYFGTGFYLPHRYTDRRLLPRRNLDRHYPLSILYSFTRIDDYFVIFCEPCKYLGLNG